MLFAVDIFCNTCDVNAVIPTVVANKGYAPIMLLLESEVQPDANAAQYCVPLVPKAGLPAAYLVLTDHDWVLADTIYIGFVWLADDNAHDCKPLGIPQPTKQ